MLRHALFVLGMTAAGCGGMTGSPLVVESAAVKSGATYQLVRRGSAKCLDVTGAATSDGTQLQQATCSTNTAQSFRVEDLGGGNVRLVNPLSNKCVDIAAAGTADGTKMQIYACNGTGAQSFVVDDLGGGFAEVRNSTSGKCMDVAAASNSDGAKVQLWTCNATDAQKWQFVDRSGGSGGGGGGGGSGGGGGGGGNPSGTIEYAPYFYTWGWGGSGYQFSSLTQMKQKGGPAAATIAFVLSGGGCQASRDIQNNLADVKSFIAAGGHVKASFGGADGTYLENACSSAGALATALTNFVNETGVTDLDFDLEQGGKSSNAGINAMRATALKQVQQQKGIRVAFTLPVNPDGLDGLGLDIVKAAHNAGVQVSFVNIMTMDYGNGVNLGTTPIASADATARQVQSIFGGSLDAAYRMVGITPMIGHNDDTENFTLDNARTLISYVKQKQIGLVAFWAIQRDQKCAGGIDLNLCNGDNSGTFQYHQIFDAVRTP
jgi:ricin-type beta-trefoil lectin protein